MKRERLERKALLIGMVIFLADLLSKWATVTFLKESQYATYHYPYGGIGVFKNFLGIEFSLIYRTNSGAAWGLLADYQIPLLLFRIFFIALLIGYLLYFNNKKWIQYPLTMILAGALGNVIDYFFYGHVIDMLHFVLWGYDYPVFNVADSAITLGVLWMIIYSFIEKPSPTAS